MPRDLKPFQVGLNLACAGDRALHPEVLTRDECFQRCVDRFESGCRFVTLAPATHAMWTVLGVAASWLAFFYAFAGFSLVLCPGHMDRDSANLKPGFSSRRVSYTV